MKKDPIIFIKHILESIKNIESFIDEVSKDSFFKNKEKQSAVIRQLEIIGEATKNIPLNFRRKYPMIEWNNIAGLRNKLIHHYFGVVLRRVWKVVKEDTPKLKKDINNILLDYSKKK